MHGQQNIKIWDENIKIVIIVICVWSSRIPHLPHALLKGYIYVSGLCEPMLQQALALEPMLSAHVGKIEILHKENFQFYFMALGWTLNNKKSKTYHSFLL